MKRGGKGTGAGAATTAVLLLALLVLAASQANGAVASRRLGVGPGGPNGCTYDQHNQGGTCYGPGGPGNSYTVGVASVARRSDSLYVYLQMRKLVLSTHTLAAQVNGYKTDFREPWSHECRCSSIAKLIDNKKKSTSF